jgi:hypothetical protein
VGTVVGTGNERVDSGAAFFVDYGLRLAGKNFGVDLTFIEPVSPAPSRDSNPFILGIPFLAFTYRSDGDAKRPGDQVTSAPSAGAVATKAGITRGF